MGPDNVCLLSGLENAKQCNWRWYIECRRAGEEKKSALAATSLACIESPPTVRDTSIRIDKVRWHVESANVRACADETLWPIKRDGVVAANRTDKSDR